MLLLLNGSKGECQGEGCAGLIPGDSEGAFHLAGEFGDNAHTEGAGGFEIIAGRESYAIVCILQYTAAIEAIGDLYIYDTACFIDLSVFDRVCDELIEYHSERNRGIHIETEVWRVHAGADRDMVGIENRFEMRA